jgi:hypothetical protein
MSKTVTISDDVARRLEARRAEGGFATLDAAAEAVLLNGLESGAANDDHLDGRSVEEIRALIAEADASGAAVEWDASAIRAEVLRRYSKQGG